MALRAGGRASLARDEHRRDDGKGNRTVGRPSHEGARRLRRFMMQNATTRGPRGSGSWAGHESRGSCHASTVSKAFTKDDASDAPLVVPARRPLPEGVTNYVTPRGLALLREELARLRSERGSLESRSADPDGPRELAAAVARMEELEDRLASAQLVEAGEPSTPRDQVRFGATVTVRSESGSDRTYQIVGVDEADIASGRVAFVAPLASALLGKGVGDVVTLRTPRGEEELEVISIA